MKNVKIGRISYINVSPVYYGLDKGLKPAWLEMVTEPPAVLNGMLSAGEIEISPVSAAAYARNHRDWILLPDLSISCFGDVLSVLLVSRVRIDDLHGKKVVMTSESASAADLVRIIFQKKGILPEISRERVLTKADLPPDADAALVIGDAALIQPWQEDFRYVYDLGRLWREMTGLPFVFAVWALRRTFALTHPDSTRAILDAFMASKAKGQGHLDDIVSGAHEKTGLPRPLLSRYFELLDCDMTDEHVKGMETFFECLHGMRFIDEKVKVEFFE